LLGKLQIFIGGVAGDLQRYLDARGQRFQPGRRGRLRHEWQSGYSCRGQFNEISSMEWMGTYGGRSSSNSFNVVLAIIHGIRLRDEV